VIQVIWTSENSMNLVKFDLWLHGALIARVGRIAENQVNE
jgi:hypothetical protein